MAPGIWVEILSLALLAHVPNKNPSNHLPIYPSVQYSFANCFLCFHIHSFASCTSFFFPHLFTASFIRSFTYSSRVHWLNALVYSFLLPLITLSFRPPSIVHVWAQSLTRSASDFFIPSLFLSLVHSFSHPRMYSSTRHFVPLFTTFWSTHLFNGSAIVSSFSHPSFNKGWLVHVQRVGCVHLAWPEPCHLVAVF